MQESQPELQSVTLLRSSAMRFPAQDSTTLKVPKFAPDAPRSFTAAGEATMMQPKLLVQLGRPRYSGVQFQTMHVYVCLDMALLMVSA